MKLLLIFGLLALLFGSFFLQNTHTDKFEQYKSEFGKFYNSDEEMYRRAIFEENVARIEAHNATPGITYTEGINQFTDLTAEEFESTYLTLLPTDKQIDASHAYPSANYIDWEQKGAVAAVKDQGQCGSCWAFSAVANLENLNFLFGSKQMVLFSEQQLVDCSKPYGNHGCQGGLMTSAYNYVKAKGIMESSKYGPYVARDQACKQDGGPFSITGFTEIKSCDDQINKLQTQTVAVAADASRWSSYSSGIFSNCGTRLNHGITLVGFGKDGTQEYWRIKNSWGTRWGEKGFMRLKYPGSTCGICNMSCIPQGPKWK